MLLLILYLLVGAILGVLYDYYEMKKPLPFAQMPALPLEIIRKVSFIVFICTGVPLCTFAALYGTYRVIKDYISVAIFKKTGYLNVEHVFLDLRKLPSEKNEAMKVLIAECLKALRKNTRSAEKADRLEERIRNEHPEWLEPRKEEINARYIS
jgi:hypothetical protein